MKTFREVGNDSRIIVSGQLVLGDSPIDVSPVIPPGDMFLLFLFDAAPDGDSQVVPEFVDIQHARLSGSFQESA